MIYQETERAWKLYEENWKMVIENWNVRKQPTNYKYIINLIRLLYCDTCMYLYAHTLPNPEGG